MNATYVRLFKVANQQVLQEGTSLVGVANILEGLSGITTCLDTVRLGPWEAVYNVPASAMITSSPPGCFRRVLGLQ